jgi:hypothetical protein
VRLTASQCFTELYNLLRKRELLTEKNRSLMEKKTRVDAIVDNIVKSGATQEQIQDVRCYGFNLLFIQFLKFLHSSFA